MRAYIITRLLILMPTLLLMSIIIFFLIRLVPGDIVDMFTAATPDDVPIDRAEAERILGLDAPVMIQYGRWMGFVPQKDGNFSGVFQGSLGDSWSRRVPVAELVSKAWPVTLQLGLMGIIIGQLIALPIGMYSALRQDKWGDYVARSIAILCISIPGFWLGTLIIVMPSIWWGHMPPIMLIRLTEDPIGNLQMFIIPAIVLGMARAGFTMRLSRTMMLEVLRQDYIRTAWAKGLSERVVVMRHALKNALIPVITSIGLQMRVMVGGTVIIEQIFMLPGMGRLVIEAIQYRDAPLICGLVLILSVAVMLINLIIDLTYGYINPRIRYK